jgi:dolichyl-phosphate-mannose-protein mannosyltransferase
VFVPSFFFLLPGVVFDYMIRGLPNWLKEAIIGVTLSILVYSFLKFSPLAYGMTDVLAPNEGNSSMHRYKWLDSWEF